eukprot:CFRG1046T1
MSTATNVCREQISPDAMPTPVRSQYDNTGIQASTSVKQKNIYGLTIDNLREFVQSHGHGKFRAQQIYDQLYEQNTQTFDGMTDLSKKLRSQLKANFKEGTLELRKELISTDGTIKRAYVIAGGAVIETVLMRYKDGRNTVCISSQAGCAMNCSFCATGQSGFTRNLTHDEIFEQTYRMSERCRKEGERLSNVVFMGMGEPMANYRNVVRAAELMNKHLGIGAPHITISTVGVVPKILKLASERMRFTLAVSLHTPYDSERNAIMPINAKYPVEELIDACVKFSRVTGRRVSFEYCLIQGQNDSPKHAFRDLCHIDRPNTGTFIIINSYTYIHAQLARLLSKMKGMCHVNLIPLNPTSGFKGLSSTQTSADSFISTLRSASGISATIRVKRGIDINAGCGQLAALIEQTNAQDTFQSDQIREMTM